MSVAATASAASANKYYDIIIIGSGIAGLYSAYTIKKMSPNTKY